MTPLMSTHERGERLKAVEKARRKARNQAAANVVLPLSILLSSRSTRAFGNVKKESLLCVFLVGFSYFYITL